MQCRKHYVSEKNKKAKGICLVKLSNEERCYAFCYENGTGKQSSFLVEWGASLERVFCFVLRGETKGQKYLTS